MKAGTAFLLIAALGGFYYYRKGQQQQQANTPPPVQETTPVYYTPPTVTPTQIQVNPVLQNLPNVNLFETKPGNNIGCMSGI